MTIFNVLLWNKGELLHRGTVWTKQGDAAQHLPFIDKQELAGDMIVSGIHGCSDHLIVGIVQDPVGKIEGTAQTLDSR